MTVEQRSGEPVQMAGRSTDADPIGSGDFMTRKLDKSLNDLLAEARAKTADFDKRFGTPVLGLDRSVSHERPDAEPRRTSAAGKSERTVSARVEPKTPLPRGRILR
jgi:hypothetical protein